MGLLTALLPAQLICYCELVALLSSQLAAAWHIINRSRWRVSEQSSAEVRCQAGCQVPDSPCHLPPRFSSETNQELIIVYQTMPALLRPCCTQCFFKSILSGFWGGVLDLVKTHLKTNKNCVTSWEDWRWRCRCTLYLSIGSVMGWHISSHLRI